MKSKIISQKRNPFLEREEIIIEISDKVTPSKEDVKKILGKEEDLIIVKKIDSNFGRELFIANVLVYDTKEAKEKIETIPKKIKKKIEEEKKKAEEEEKKKAEEEEKKKAEEEEKKKAEENSGGNEQSQ